MESSSTSKWITETKASLTTFFKTPRECSIEFHEQNVSRNCSQEHLSLSQPQPSQVGDKAVASSPSLSSKEIEMKET